MKPFLFLFRFLCGTMVHAQNYTIQKTNWQEAGYRGTKPVFSQTVNVLNYGADNTGTTSSNTALLNAMAALNGQAGVVFFPAGTYFFNNNIVINRDSIVLRGAGYDSTELRFDLSGQLSNLIQVSGQQSIDTAVLTATAVRGTFTATVVNAAPFHVNDWVTLSMDDQAYMTATWAYGSLSQVMQIQSISGNTIMFRSPFRFNYALSNAPLIRRMIPRNNVGMECLKIRREDSTVGQSSNITFDYAVNCWINGIESDTVNFAHVEINHASNIEVTNSYFHDAFAYGGNGQAYGVLLQFGTGECLVEANYFKHLRHSMLLQAGANGNVIAHNYSILPFWTEPSLPDSAAGDIVLPGNYPFLNLCEGNIIQNIVIDDSHGKNGPLNTFLRNRAEGFGIFMNFSPATDSVQLIGNEITDTITGLYFIQGTGHVLYGNNLKGTYVTGDANIPDTSLYLVPGEHMLCANGNAELTALALPGRYNKGSNYARARVAAGKPAACACVFIAPSGVEAVAHAATIRMYPNPAQHIVQFRKGNSAVMIDRVELIDAAGRTVLVAAHASSMVIDALPVGVYMVRMIAGKDVTVQRLVKQ